jgi:cyclase
VNYKKKIRVIPVVLFKEGRIVQSKNFSRHMPIGNAHHILDRLSSWSADEVVYLDISRNNNWQQRKDIKQYKSSNLFDLLKNISKHVFMPFSVGGKISTIENAKKILNNGADKVVINSQAYKEPSFIKKLAEEFGSQSVVVSIDVKKKVDSWVVYIDNGKYCTETCLSKYLDIVQNNLAGEIIINSIDKDGAGNGYDIDLIKQCLRRTACNFI